jgi:hypothetical protein
MKLGTHMPDGERRKPIDIEVCRTTLSYDPQYHHQACVYQVSFRSDISFLRYCAETKKLTPGQHSSYYKLSSYSQECKLRLVASIYF